MPVPATGKIRSLRVQATQTVDLAFNMPGIVSSQNFDHTTRSGPAFLGQRVSAFNFEQKVYEKLGETKGDKVPDAARLKYDSAAMRQLISGGT